MEPHPGLGGAAQNRTIREQTPGLVEAGFQIGLKLILKMGHASQGQRQ
jgi:hypothetical protein